jgi:predicted protein tyrosine phosphatase
LREQSFPFSDVLLAQFSDVKAGTDGLDEDANIPTTFLHPAHRDILWIE